MERRIRFLKGSELLNYEHSHSKIAVEPISDSRLQLDEISEKHKSVPLTISDSESLDEIEMYVRDFKTKNFDMIEKQRQITSKISKVQTIIFTIRLLRIHCKYAVTKIMLQKIVPNRKKNENNKIIFTPKSSL